MPALTRTAAWLAALAVVLIGCGGVAADDAAITTEDARAADEADPTPSPSPSATSFVTVAHRYDETTVTGVLERVVTVGLTDHDAVLALGTVPVGTTEWYGGHPTRTPSGPLRRTRWQVPSRASSAPRPSWTTRRSPPSTPT